MVAHRITQLLRARTALTSAQYEKCMKYFWPISIRMAPGSAPARPRPLSRGIVNTKQTKLTSRRARPAKLTRFTNRWIKR